MNANPDTPVSTAEPAEFAPFWSLLRERRLGFPRCTACARYHWYPKLLCPYCFGASIEWTEVTGEATLYSWTSVRHAFQPAYRDKIPYTVALVEFSDAPGVRLVTQLIDGSAPTLRCGMLLRPIFNDTRGPIPTVVFRP